MRDVNEAPGSPGRRAEKIKGGGVAIRKGKVNFALSSQTHVIVILGTSAYFCSDRTTHGHSNHCAWLMCVECDRLM